ncbi:MAG: putative DNA binding domain-containing protein [Rikenellaceae bacterium]
MRTLEQQIKILEEQITFAKTRGSNSGEVDWLEFKTNIGESRCSITYERVGEYISGLANAACIKDKQFAYLILGVEDATWSIVGTNLIMSETKYGNQDYELWLRRNLKPIIGFDIEEFEYNERRIVMFIIPAALAQPVEFKGVDYIRVGSNLTKLADFRDYKQKIFNSDKDWSAQIVPDATIDDLNVDAIKVARELFYDKNKNNPRYENLAEDMLNWSDIVFLNKAKLTKKGRITNAAIVLLGKAESEVLISPSVSKIRWVLMSNDDTERDYDIITCPLIIGVTELYKKIRNITYRYMNPNLFSLFPEEVKMYDPYIIREMLHNAIAHQDYMMRGMINVIEYDDKLVFSNRGAFIPENIKSVIENDAPEDKYRNPFLAQAMVELNMVDTIGSGIRRVFRIQRSKLFLMPDYNLANNKVVVTIIGKVINDDFSILLYKNPDLKLSEVEMLNRVAFKRKLTKFEIEHLRRKKMIEGRYPNIYISKSLAQTVGKKTEYTKNKGLDDKYYKDLVITAIKQHKQLSRKDIDQLLESKLPDILSEIKKKNKITNLLASLRKEDIIMVGEKKMWQIK